MSNIDSVLKKQIEKIKIDDYELDKIKKISFEFCRELEKKLKIKNINADLFIGGSLAKNTLIKTDENKYDVDIFLRFINEKEDISSILGKILGKDFIRIHCSRDYYQKKIDNITIEIIPVIKIKSPEEASNITDLSYFHVNYVLKQIRKDAKLADEIRLAKSFCHGQDCYGAESYIRGFSGYALELLIINYGSFLKFLKTIATSKDDKIIVDYEKNFKNKKEILMELNESKIQSPIILVDPTFKTRNAASSLSQDTFNKFKVACINFIRNPSENFFLKKKVEEEFRNFSDVKKMIIKTNKQAGDIAGTKSKKFFNFLLEEIKKEFLIKKTGFSYDDGKNIAIGYLVVDKKKDEIIRGPDITNLEHLKRFKEHHPNAFIKNQISYAEIQHNLSFEKFFKKFLYKDKRIIKEMRISELKLK